MRSEKTLGSAEQAGKKTSANLFTRIIFKISVPLIILAAIFGTVQLTNQIKTLNNFNRIESQFILESLYPLLQKFATSPDAERAKWQDKILAAREVHPNIAINLYDLTAERLLISDTTHPWTGEDSVASSKSIELAEAGQRYLIDVRKKNQQMVAYIPLHDHHDSLHYVARIHFSLANLREAFYQSTWLLGSMFFFILLAGASIAHGLAKAIIQPIRSLNQATREIMKGNFGKHVEIHTGDEIQALAEIFNKMSDYLIDMKTRAEDANPLTQLPGNQLIFKELKRRIHERHKFVFFHIDIDRFKVFNDQYGLAKGDEVLKKTGELLRKSIQAVGSSDDFIGHQGGDDFVVICKASHAEKIGRDICHRFDKEITPSLYPKEVIEQGFVEQLDRRRFTETGEERMIKFPLMAISLAGVSNARKDFADYYDCMERTVPVKKIVKQNTQSCFLIQD